MAVAPPSPSSAAAATATVGATTAPGSQSMDLQPSLKQQQPPPPPPQSDAASSATSSPDLTSRFSRSPGSNRDYESLYTISRSEEYRQLFRLPPEEVLIQDFNCALQESILLQGHMYLFDHYLCFYANIFGFETKKIIPFNEVANVRRAKTAGIFPNAIEIFASGKKLFFASFLSRDEAFKLIAERWSLYGEGAKGIGDDQDSKSESGSFLNGVVPLEEAGNDELPASDLDSGERKLETADSDDGDHPSNTEDDVTPPALSVQNSMEQFEDLPVEEKVSTSDANINWMEEASDAPQISKSFTKVAESKFPIKVEEFFNQFFSDDAVGFVESFRNQCGDKDFKCTKWSTRDNLEIEREVSFQHPIKIYLGAKYGGCKELQTYRVYKSSHLVIRTSQEVNDVPYADYFHVEGCWDVQRGGDQSRESCILRVYVTVVFTKKTMFKGKIEQSTMDECREAFATWINLAHQLLKQKKIEKGEGAAAIVHKNEIICSESQTKIMEASAQPCQRAELRPKVNLATNCPDSTQQSENDTMLLNISKVASVSKALGTKFCSILKGQGKLQVLLITLFVLILLLMQLSIVVLLIRPQQIHASPQVDHMATTGFVGSQSKAIATALLEKRIHLLKDEMLLVEAHLERMKNEQMLLKAQLQDLEHLVRQT